tara:strand:- start:220 stop:537 length:318 start_codon:yes stop_codon:yes gene_type:complete
MRHRIKSFLNTLKGIKQHIWKLASFDSNIKTLIHKTNQLSNTNEEIDDIRRRLDRIENSIALITVKFINTDMYDGNLQDLVDQMYGEHQAREDINEDITYNDLPF